MNRWIQAARPLTLPAAISPVLIAGSLLDSALTNPVFYLILLCAVLIQVNTNYVNDLCDFLKGADTEDRIGPKRTLASGLIKAGEIKVVIIILSLIILILGAYLVCLGGRAILVIGLCSLLFSFLYTAGPYPLAYLGLGEVFVLIFFGPVATWGTTWILAQVNSIEAIYHGLASGMLSSALLIVNNLRDYKTDKKANKNTLIVRFGQNFGKLEFSLFLTLALLLAAHKEPLMLLLTPLTLLPIYKVFSFKDEKQLLPVLVQVVILLTSYTILFIVLRVK